MTRYPYMDYGTLLIYALAAVGPAAYWMWKIYRKDTVEKEPAYLLGKLIFGGVLAGVAALILETAADYLESVVIAPLISSVSLFMVITAVFVAVIEESCKYFFLKKFSWKDQNFNYRFDGIVYAVFVSLGFAAFENVLYIFLYDGLSAALPRALLTIPAHMGFSVYMGMYYAYGRLYANRGNTERSKKNLHLSLLVPVVMHAVYDGTLMVGTDVSLIVFGVFVILMNIGVSRTLQRESLMDGPLY